MTRSPPRRDDRRHRDRDYGRRSYSRERRDDRQRRRSRERPDDRYGADRQYGRHDTHDRKRSYARSPPREGGRDRYDGRDSRDTRDRYDDRNVRDRYDDRDRYEDRDRKRARRDSPPARRDRRDDSRDRRSARETPDLRAEIAPRRATTPDRQPAADRQAAAEAAAEEERLKRERQEKVRAWKKGRLAAQDQAETEGADASKAASPAPNAGRKFDPKAIAKKAKEKMEKKTSTLGGDVIINKPAAIVGPLPAGMNIIKRPPTAAAAKNLQTKKIAGFGLGKSAGSDSKPLASSKLAADLDEDEEVTRELERLPDMPDIKMAADDDALSGEDEDDGGNEMDDEDNAAAAREAAEKRAQMIQKADQADDAEGEATQEVTEDGPETAEQEEEIDPLDAYMQQLVMPSENPPAPTSGRKQEVQMYNSDDEHQLDAIGNGAEDLLNLTKKSTKKDIPKVDHSKIDYEPFQKNFYIESTELAEMTEDEVNIARADLDNIIVRGKDVPKPISKWSQIGLSLQVQEIITDQLRYQSPTSIQCQALPTIMSGRDVVGVAKTGSGKTMAFVLPLLRHIKAQRPLAKLDGPIGIILAPTRELAVQIHKDCSPFAKALRIRAVCAYGGQPIKEQIADLKRGAEIVIATAGRLIDLLAANSGRVINLMRVTYIVLDEADRMFDMGFEPQISRILGNIRPDRQTILFSATFPRNMEAAAAKHTNKNRVSIQVGGRSVVAPEITQQVEVRPESTKFLRLLELLGNLYAADEDVRSLIFVERQETADMLLKDLMNKQYSCNSIHGGRDQIDRDTTIQDFKAGNIPILIATSVAARGLDVKQLKLVVNFDCPNHKEDYVHRAGRTGRAGNTGTAVTFITPEQDRFASFLCKALEESGVEIPEELSKMKEAFEEKIKSGAAVKAGGGFGGRGIERLDAARQRERARDKARYKTEDDDNDEEEEKEKDSKIGKIDEQIKKAATSTVGLAEERWEADNLVMHINNAMKVQKTSTTPAPIAGRPSSGGSAAATMGNALERAAAAAASINAKLGAKGEESTDLTPPETFADTDEGAARAGAPPDNRGPDAGAYHATLHCNDFPQRARWAVTNRTNIAKILEATGASITSKGIYYAPGHEPKEGGEPKLYLLVEGDTEIIVENAMRELLRLLKEGTLAQIDQDGKAGKSSTGRYSVV